MSGLSSPDAEDRSQQAGVGPLNYDELPGLEDIYLEDSFVREIVETPSALRFVLVAALRRTHPFYQRPRSDDRHCYVPATLTFPDARVKWTTRATHRFTDANGAVDLGNIDRLVAPAEGGYRIEGDFGALEIVRSFAPVFTVLGASPEGRARMRGALDAWVRGVPFTADPGHAPEEAEHPGHDHSDHDHARHDHAHGK